jgi:hypothetical protein
VFARIWTTWHGTRGTTVSPVEGEHQLFGFLTTDPNDVVAPIHPRAMPVTLMTPAEEALRLQRPLPDGQLAIVARGERKDERQLSWPSVNCAQRLLFIRTLQTVRRSSLSSSAIWRYPRPRAVLAAMLPPGKTLNASQIWHAQLIGGAEY